MTSTVEVIWWSI